MDDKKCSHSQSEERADRGLKMTKQKISRTASMNTKNAEENQNAGVR